VIVVPGAARGLAMPTRRRHETEMNETANDRGLPTWKEVVDVDLPKSGAITEGTRSVSAARSRRFRGSVRVACGKILTDADLDRLRAYDRRQGLP